MPDVLNTTEFMLERAALLQVLIGVVTSLQPGLLQQCLFISQYTSTAELPFARIQ